MTCFVEVVDNIFLLSYYNSGDTNGYRFYYK